MTKDRCLALFGVDERELEALAAAALKGGGSYCDLYFENTESNDLLLRDGAVTTGSFSVDYGCGVRVLCGEKTGYAYTESTSRAALEDAVRSAAAISGGSAGAAGACAKAAGSKPRRGLIGEGNDFYPFQDDWRKEPSIRFLPWLERLESEIRRLDGRTEKVIAMLSNQVSDILMYNSLGEMACDTRPIWGVSVTAIFRQGEDTRTNSASRSFRGGAEMLSERLLTEVAQLVTQGVDELFAARRPKGGKMSVVMGAGPSGILLHEARGHAFEADFNRKGQSVFSDRMGKRVCPEGINIVDDGTIPFNLGALNTDDELVPGQKTFMVQDGILTSYLHDRISAAHYGVPSTGNGRRESFRFPPLPRMRATYMESGRDGSREDIIRSVRKGIYVDSFSNGQVKIGEGDFTFFVKRGFLIEDGRLTMPVSDINIIGNGPRALADIAAVGSDLVVDNSAWTCGKEQNVCVSCGMPTVLVKELTVGGV